MTRQCILCGKCLEVCPLLNATRREELGPRAKTELSAMLRDDELLLSGEDVTRLAGLCLGCHRCRKACSHGVDAPGMVSALRGAHPDFKRWLWKTWLTNAGSLWSSGSTVAKLIPKKFQPEKLGRHLKMLAGLKGGVGLEPCLSVRAFPKTYEETPVLLFAGCTANHVQKDWLASARFLLEGLGVHLLPDDFKCCGSGLRAAGCPHEAEDVARHNIQIWRAAGRPKVLVFCASCLAGLSDYDDFSNEPEKNLWQASLTPLAGWIGDVDFLIADDAPASLGYHRPCHHDAADSDFMFLKRILGGRLETASDKECCGFGGVMGLGAPELADQVTSQCWDRLGAMPVVVTGCSACAARLGATAPERVRVGHWLEMINRGSGGRVSSQT
ncbi:(Fe-S)-binding protein [Pseudodesulfovibrio piezophilus]|nr:(Fe-S)-binding protein [Pseudodesulfovibrio piezophilus]